MADLSEALDAAAEQLYGALPGAFIASRDALAKDAKAGGDKAGSAAIKALRRPSVAAWLVNLLARSDDGLTELSELSEQLREAQSNLDGSAMKSLGAQRLAIVGQLAARASQLGAEADPAYKDTQATREQVTATLTAAVADPAAEAAVASGRLVTPLSYSGFGEVDLTDAVATPLRLVPPLKEDEAPAKKARDKPAGKKPAKKSAPSKDIELELDEDEEPQPPAPAAEPELEPEPEPDAAEVVELPAEEEPDTEPDEDETAEDEPEADEVEEEDEPEPETPEVDEAALEHARSVLKSAERKLAVAEEAFSQARARRQIARQQVDQARAELDELEDA